MITGNISLEEFKNSAGKELEPSDWLLIDQARIDCFAEATSDFQFIHVDAEKAAATPFGTTIAHGFLSLSLLSHLMSQTMLIPEGTVMGINYGSDKVRYLQPVKVNSRVRSKATIKEITENPGGQLLVKISVAVEIENEKRPALIAEILSLYIVKEQA
ncbi:MAG: MaoC family dehydratase [Xanthomonadales bacterium]|nr:MaoC family dehydratase [Xanthomonadales bacterium]